MGSVEKAYLFNFIVFKMPRIGQRKTTRGQADLGQIRLNCCSLFNYIPDRDATGVDDNEEKVYKTHNLVFNQAQECELLKYFMRCAHVYFGLNKMDIMKLAYVVVAKCKLS